MRDRDRDEGKKRKEKEKIKNQKEEEEQAQNFIPTMSAWVSLAEAIILLAHNINLYAQVQRTWTTQFQASKSSNRLSYKGRS